MMKGPNQGEGTVVGANVKLQGVLKDTGDILIHGSVDGEVISDKTVTVTESAVVKGPIAGEIVTIGGTIRGSVDGRQKLEILPSGRVSGSISTQQLIIQPGAIFNGKCAMGEAEKEKDRKLKDEEAGDQKPQPELEKPEAQEVKTPPQEEAELTYELE